MSPALQADSLPAEPQRKPKDIGVGSFGSHHVTSEGLENEISHVGGQSHLKNGAH